LRPFSLIFLNISSFLFRSSQQPDKPAEKIAASTGQRGEEHELHP